MDFADIPAEKLKPESSGKAFDNNIFATEFSAFDSTVNGALPQSGVTDEAEGEGKVLAPDEFEELEHGESNAVVHVIEVVQQSIEQLWTKHSKHIWIALGAIVFLGFHVLLGFAITIDWGRAVWLLVLLATIWLFLIYYFPVKWLYRRFNGQRFAEAGARGFTNFIQFPYVSTILYVSVTAGVLAAILAMTWGDDARMMSLAGLIILLIISFLCSTDPARINWRPVFWGLLLQFVLGVLVLLWPDGETAFSFLANQVVIFLDYTNNGTLFVYGFIADPAAFNLTYDNGQLIPAPMAFSSLQVVVFFGAIVSMAYYVGILQFILVQIAWLMQLTMGTTAAESLNAAACIFLGQTEAALLIKSCLISMTESEIHAVMTAGYACIAGSLFAVYISYGVGCSIQACVKACPTFLMSATVMSAPASIAVAKILMPETQKSKQKDVKALKFPAPEESGLLECISNGAVAGAGYVVAIVANLVGSTNIIVMLALLAFVDAICSWCGGMVGYPQLSLQEIMGYVFYPLAYVMGASAATDRETRQYETMQVAQLMGIKTIVNEFVAYESLGCLVANNEIADRPRMIATYALCGFSNIGSIGIQLGIMSGMCPERRKSFARCAVRGLLAGSIACFMTACMAGMLVVDPSEERFRCNATCVTA